ncbi:MAG: hypothetical protein AAFR61_18335 [Bacteroidota bacterium]
MKVFTLLFWCVLVLSGLSMTGCGETYLQEPTFTDPFDTTRYNRDNWYYFSREARALDNIQVYPFSYRFFGNLGQGFLMKSEQRIYFFEEKKGIDQKFTLLDFGQVPGDTICKFSDLHYHLLFDIQEDAASGERIYYILRRSRKGLRNLEERMIWALSLTRGIISVANYTINDYTGQVTLEMLGDPDYFKGEDFIRHLKLVDYNQAYQVDHDRGIIYLFDKQKGLLKSRDYRSRKDLHAYTFTRKRTENLTDFRIQLLPGTVSLVVGDSCFYFSRSLALERSTLCED